MLTLGLSVWGGEEGGSLALGLPGPPPGAQEVTQLCPVTFSTYQDVWRQGGNRREGRLSQAGSFSAFWGDAIFPSRAKPVCPLGFFNVAEC